MSLYHFSDIANNGIVENIGIASDGCKVIAILGCNIPKASNFNYDKILQLSLNVLDLNSESECYLVYFHSKNLTNGAIGQFVEQQSRLKSIFSNIPHITNRANAKKIFIVHPDMILKTLWCLATPISVMKCSHKITYVNTLHDLRQQLPYCELLFHLPIPVLEQDKFIVEKCLSNLCEKGDASFQTQLLKTIRQTAKHYNNKFLDFLEMKGTENVPFGVKHCVDYLSNPQILSMKGLFRSSQCNFDSSHQVINALQQGISIDLEEFKDAPMVAAVLKELLQTMPEPPFTFSLYEEIVAFNKLHNDQKLLGAQKIILYQLPKNNYDLLIFLLTFLQRLLEFKSDNKMSAKTIALIFAPVFVRPPQEKNRNLTVTLIEMYEVVEFVRFLLENFCEILAIDI